LTENEGGIARWSSDGKWIYFLGWTDQVPSDIWSLSVDSRKAKPVTALTGRRGQLGELGLATDGRYVYFTWEEPRGDIWVADIIQPPGK